MEQASHAKATVSQEQQQQHHHNEYQAARAGGLAPTSKVTAKKIEYYQSHERYPSTTTLSAALRQQWDYHKQ
jgi:hypothetical protein